MIRYASPLTSPRGRRGFRWVRLAPHSLSGNQAGPLAFLCVAALRPSSTPDIIDVS